MNNIFFQYYSLVITIVCVIVMMVVSHMTEQPAYEKIGGLTFSTLTDKDREESRKSWGAADVAFSVLVLVLIAAAYLYFSG